MSECRKIQGLLEAYELRVLDAGTTAVCEEHLRACAACREGLHEVRDTIRALERLSAPAGADLGLDRRILARVAAERASVRRRWIWALQAALWLLAVGLSVAALDAAAARDRTREDPTAGIASRMEEQETRLARLEAARAETPSSDAAQTAFAVRLEGLEREVRALRAEGAGLGDAVARLDLLRGELASLEHDIAEQRSRMAKLDRTVGELAARGARTEEQAAPRHELAVLAARIEEQAESHRALATRIAAADAVPRPPARAPEAIPRSRPSPEAPAVRTPWDAAFKMASGVVHDRGRNLRERMRDYQSDLFRIYGSND